MREIKFRAFADSEMTRSFVLKDDYKAIGYYAARGFPIMQYTGLHDKNGKEIYEGDILSGDGRWIVIFEYSQWGLDCLEKERRHEWLPFDECDIEKCEVIGNIHDNPELLEAHA